MKHAFDLCMHLLMCHRQTDRQAEVGAKKHDCGIGNVKMSVLTGRSSWSEAEEVIPLATLDEWNC